MQLLILSRRAMVRVRRCLAALALKSAALALGFWLRSAYSRALDMVLTSGMMGPGCCPRVVVSESMPESPSHLRKSKLGRPGLPAST